MNIDADPEWLSNLTESARNSIAVNNRRIVSGSDEILVNPAYENESDDSLKQSVEEILSSTYVTPGLRKVEDSNAAKFGPRSIAIGWEDRKGSLFSYFDKEGDDSGVFDYGSGQLRTLSVQGVSKTLIKSSSAGLPYMRRKGLVLDDAIRNWQGQEGEFPCVLYTRTQEEKKTRNVWGYPISDTISEQRFFYPWLRVEQSYEWRSALLGPDQVDLAVSKLLRSRSDDEVIICIDFSSYDASIEPAYTRWAFSHVASAFQSHLHDELYGIYRRFISIPVFTPDGEVSGFHGVPSGSTFTNSIDSLVQFEAAGEFAERCQIQGDDGIYVARKGEEGSLYKRFSDHGLVVNESKSEVYDSEEALFLQRYYSRDYPSRDNGGLGGVYSLYRALNRIKYLERWTDFESMGIEGSDFFSLRTIMILENCKHHPAFEEFVAYVQSLDNKGLDFSKRGLKAFSDSLKAKARAGLYSGKSFEEGLVDFETIKVIYSL